jgi:hypothetical protein
LAIFPGLVMVPAEMVKLALLVSKIVVVDALATLTLAWVVVGPVTACIVGIRFEYNPKKARYQHRLILGAP